MQPQRENGSHWKGRRWGGFSKGVDLEIFSVSLLGSVAYLVAVKNTSHCTMLEALVSAFHRVFVQV